MTQPNRRPTNKQIDVMSQIVSIVPQVRGLEDEAMERATLSCILRDNARYFDVAHLLSPRDFSLPLHAYLYYAMQTLLDSGAAVDVLTIKEHLQKAYGDKLALDNAHLAEALAHIYKAAADSASIASYAATVMERAQRARMVKQAMTQAEQARDMSKPLPAIIDACTHEFFKATEQVEVVSVGAGDVAEDYIAYIQAQKAKGEDGRVPLGIEALDTSNAVPLRGTVTVLVGSTGHGKSTLALGAALDHGMAHNGKEQAAYVFSYEMGRFQVMRNWLAMLTGVYRSKLINPSALSDTDMALLQEQVTSTIKAWPVYLYDRQNAPQGSANEGRRKLLANSASTHTTPKLIVVDGLWLATTNDGRNSDNMSHYQTIVEEWQHIAQEFDAAVLILHQFRLEVVNLNKSEVPNESHIEGKGYASKSADNVLALVRHKDEDPKARLYNLKLRYGSRIQTPLDIYYDSTYARYVNALTAKKDSTYENPF